MARITKPGPTRTRTRTFSSIPALTGTGGRLTAIDQNINTQVQPLAIRKPPSDPKEAEEEEEEEEDELENDQRAYVPTLPR